MSGKSPPLYCTLILITMHSHQSYLNITTVIHSYKYSTTVDISTIETYRKGKNVKMFRWDQRLQIQNLFMAFKQVSR